MNVKEILVKYLTENDFAGLTDPGECGCSIDDLAPCDGCFLDCQPAKSRACNTENCDNPCDAGKFDGLACFYVPTPPNSDNKEAVEQPLTAESAKCTRCGVGNKVEGDLCQSCFNDRFR